MSEFSELHDELRSVATDLLAKDTVYWPLLISAGWVGLDASAHAGGAGATFAEVAVICEELGRAAAVTGYLGGAVLAVGALNAVQ
ncbi:acyl-CoA dehydrogenase family protein, partial [Microtetraspora sp. AC03309]